MAFMAEAGIASQQMWASASWTCLLDSHWWRRAEADLASPLTDAGLGDIWESLVVSTVRQHEVDQGLNTCVHLAPPPTPNITNNQARQQTEHPPKAKQTHQGQ